MDEKKLTDFKHRSERNHEKEQELLEQIRSSANEALPRILCGRRKSKRSFLKYPGRIV